MPDFSTELFLSTLSLVGAVIVISALLSGFIERSGLPQTAVFLVLGAVIGPSGLGWMDAGLDSPVLRVVATLSLALVLFTDAVSLNLTEVRKNGLLSFLVVGPGTVLSAALIALAAWWLLGISPALAAILGAALASTDPVLLRGLVRRPEVDGSVRQALRLESGMNDVVLLPIVLVATSLLTHNTTQGSFDWGRLAIDMLLLGPAAGVIAGLVGVAALDFTRRKIGVRRDYESIYSLGVAFVAFAAAESVHGSGFLAAFAAGLTVSALDVELCDCFLEYGETTSEMLLLFTFVLFGSSVIWSGLGIIGPATLLFTLAVFVARPAAFLPALSFSRLTWPNRLLISWFGPRGLSSLLLVMLAVFAGVEGSQRLLTVCCLVVLVSVVLHGLSPILILRQKKSAQSGTAAAIAAPPVPPVQETSKVESAQPDAALTSTSCALDGVCSLAPAAVPTHPEYVSIEDLQEWQHKHAAVILVDSRTDRTYDDSDLVAEGAVRVHPDKAVREAERLQLPKETLLAVFCA